MRQANNASIIAFPRIVPLSLFRVSCKQVTLRDSCRAAVIRDAAGERHVRLMTKCCRSHFSQTAPLPNGAVARPSCLGTLQQQQQLWQLLLVGCYVH